METMLIKYIKKRKRNIYATYFSKILSCLVVLKFSSCKDSCVTNATARWKKLFHNWFIKKDQVKNNDLKPTYNTRTEWVGQLSLIQFFFEICIYCVSKTLIVASCFLQTSLRGKTQTNTSTTHVLHVNK